MLGGPEDDGFDLSLKQPLQAALATSLREGENHEIAMIAAGCKLARDEVLRFVPGFHRVCVCQGAIAGVLCSARGTFALKKNFEVKREWGMEYNIMQFKYSEIQLSPEHWQRGR